MSIGAGLATTALYPGEPFLEPSLSAVGPNFGDPPILGPFPLEVLAFTKIMAIGETGFTSKPGAMNIVVSGIAPNQLLGGVPPLHSALIPNRCNGGG